MGPKLTPTALQSFPTPLPMNLTEHEMFGPLATAVRDLANDNIITAVMLTGVMFLQVSFLVGLLACQADGGERQHVNDYFAIPALVAQPPSPSTR